MPCDDPKRTDPAIRILLMDDEEMIRDVAGRMLKSLGHDQTVVADGHDALDAYRKALEAGNPFHMVILDWHVKAGMGGAETAKKLISIDPSALILASSGDYGLQYESEFSECGFAGIISKPYSMKDLKVAIERFVSHIASGADSQASSGSIE